MTDNTVPNTARDDSIAQPFDQTNGVVPGIEGDSDGSEISDHASAAEREDAKEGHDSDVVADYRQE